MDENSGFKILSLNNRGPRDFKKRKAHQKTKFGCLTCRAKRVKCDELKPICVRCLRNTRPCAYDEPAAVPNSIASFSVLRAVTVDPLTSPGAKNGAFSVDVVRHFQRNWDKIFHMPGIYRIISLSQSTQLVYNGILAISASHLRHISPGITQHRVAEHSYQSLALEQYQKMLNTPRETLGQSGVETLLISAILLNILTFPLPESDADYDQNTSWVFGAGEDLNGWLALQAGIKPLMISATAQVYETRSSIGQTIFGCDGGNWPTPIFRLDLAELPDAWIKTFNLDDPESIDAYGQPIAILRKLRIIEPLSLNAFRNLLFVWKMSIRFRSLLCRKDEKAIWLFGYWLGLLCRYEGAWWCEKRVRRDYHAVSMFFEQRCLPERPGSEGEVWREMMNEFELAPTFVCT